MHVRNIWQKVPRTYIQHTIQIYITESLEKCPNEELLKLEHLQSIAGYLYQKEIESLGVH